MAKKKFGTLPILIGGIVVGAGIMYVGKDKIKGLLNQASNMSTAARARRFYANRARMRRAGYVV